MIVWCIVLVMLGAWGLVRDLVGPDIPGFMNPMSNAAIMLVALGLLVRMRQKILEAKRENLHGRLAALEAALAERGPTPSWNAGPETTDDAEPVEDRELASVE